jgi:VIT1/CCC1 family predicted Fe2+/Mn2+ transporter
MRHPEKHRTQRIGWLRAAVLGANDGIVSTASLCFGRRCSGSRFSNRLGRRRCWPRRWSYVDGCRRVRVCQGGAPVIVAASRVTFWGALAMALTAGVGALFGVSA